MPDSTETKKYLINVESNLDEYANEAALAKKNVDELTASNKALKESGTASQSEIEKSNAALKVAQNEYKVAQTLLTAYQKGLRSETNSRKELNEILKLQQYELGKLGDGYIKDAQGILRVNPLYEEQTKKIKATKDAIILLDKAQGDGRSSVGLYSEAIKSSLGEMQMLPGAAGQAASSISRLTTAFKALIANPIVSAITAIIGVFAGLIKIFKSTDSGATELQVRFEQVKAVIDVLRNRVVAFAGAVGDIFRGNWKEAAEGFRNTFASITDQLNLATEAARNYVEELDSIEDSENNFISRAAEIENAQAKLLFTAYDRTKSTEERKKALEDSLALSEEEVKFNREIARRKLQNEVQYLADKNKYLVEGQELTAGDIMGFIRMTDEEQEASNSALLTLRNNNEAKFAEIEKLYADWIKADTAFYNENRRNISKISGFEEELNAERKARQDKFNKEREDAEKKALESLKETIQLQMLEARGDPEKMKEALKFQYEQLSAQTDVSETQRLIMKRQYEEAVAKVDEDYRKKKFEEDKRFAEEQAAWKAEDDAAKFEYQRMQNENDLQALTQILDMEYQALLGSAEYEAMTYNQKLLAEEQYNSAKKQLSQARIDQMDMEKAMVADALGAMSEAVGETTLAGKAFAIAEATINTWVAASKALADPTIPSTIARIALMTTIILQGLMTVKRIVAVKVPGKGSGGGSVGGAGATAISASPAAARSFAPGVGSSILNQPQLTQNQINALPNQQVTALTAEDIANAVGKLPPPVVTVEDINARTDDVRKVEVRATI